MVSAKSYLSTGYGGNIAPIQVALVRLKENSTPGIFQLTSWYALPEVCETGTELFLDNDGQHATASEVAVTMNSWPQFFKNKATKPTTIERPNFNWPLSAEEFRKTFPDGRMLSAP